MARFRKGGFIAKIRIMKMRRNATGAVLTFKTSGNGCDGGYSFEFPEQNLRFGCETGCVFEI